MASEELQHALQRVSGTTLDAAGAANVWAGTGIVRTNFCTNPSLGVDATGWTGPSATRVAQGTGWAFQADGSVTTYLTTPASVGGAGQFWSGSIVISGPAGRTAQVYIHDGVSYLTPILTIVLTGTLQTITMTSSAAVTTGTAPKIYIDPNPTGGAWTAGQMLTATNALLEQVSSVGIGAGTYFDGSSSGGAWTGAPNASTSTLHERGGLELVGALNAKAGTSGVDLLGVCNVLAGTPGQGVGINACAATFV